MSSPSPDGPSAMSTERARAVVAINVVFAVIASVAVVARFWARKLKGVRPLIEDWLIVIALIFYYITVVISILQTTMGRLGHHLTEGITMEQMVYNGKLSTFEQFAYPITMGCVRWSICAFLYHIFVTKNLRRVVIGVIIVNAAWIIFSIVIVAARCTPFSLNWDQTEAGHCLPQVPVVSAIAAWGLAIEVVIWSIPIPAIWNLHLPASQKFGLTAIFGLGLFDIGVGIARLVTTLQVKETDPLWSEVPALEWLAIEPSVAILVACMCLCRPVIDKIFPAGWRESLSSSLRNNSLFRRTGSTSGASGYSTKHSEKSSLEDASFHGRSLSHSNTITVGSEKMAQDYNSSDENVHVQQEVEVHSHHMV